ncbi:hypothetical protein CSV75_03940 [Sporosarcina sp. P18a]|uniref:hypothetical protein n=1 Tax=Sporosarcina sp. P18a TaxID=2048259 RepID=UPI000C168E00|nr:hypothetical protein [Sporosarcina sp. P18a]PIC80939.1 hypothetical protein CSV75_03940 [Sporosarcina sp. P18a]
MPTNLEPIGDTTFQNDKEFHIRKSGEYYQKARDYFENDDIVTSIKWITKSNEHLVKSFAKDKKEIEVASNFFGLNYDGYKAAKEIIIPLDKIDKEDVDLIHREVCWYTLNGINANYVLMAFLMFKDYGWNEFDDEMIRVKASNNPEQYELHYFIKIEFNKRINHEEYKEKFYSLSLDARVLLTSYNAIGRKRNLKKGKDIESFYYNRGAIELERAGYIHSTETGLTIEFPVKEKKQVMFEKKKLEILMRHLSTTAYWNREYKKGKSDFKNREFSSSVFLVNGTGGSTLCKIEAIRVKNAKRGDILRHSIGCKCTVMTYRNPDRLSESQKVKYGL